MACYLLVVQGKSYSNLILFAAIQHQQKYQLLDIQNQNLQQENTHLHILFSHAASITVTTLSYSSANGYTKIGVLECKKKRTNTITIMNVNIVRHFTFNKWGNQVI